MCSWTHEFGSDERRKLHDHHRQSVPAPSGRRRAATPARFRSSGNAPESSRRLKRGYYSFLILVIAYAISFLLARSDQQQGADRPLSREILLSHLRSTTRPSEFGMDALRRTQLPRTEEKLAQEAGAGNWVLMPPYPYSATESLLDLPGSPPHAPSAEHIVWNRRPRPRRVCAAGLRIQCLADICADRHCFSAKRFGVFVGALLGYFGGKLDISGPAPDRDLVVAAVPLHDHHHQFHCRADLSPRRNLRPAAFVLAARSRFLPPSTGWASRITSAVSSIGKRPRTMSEPRLRWAFPSLRSCSNISCRTR